LPGATFGDGRQLRVQHQFVEQPLRPLKRPLTGKVRVMSEA
jgi:hypothetical protein